MTKPRFCFTLFLLICFSLPLTVTAQTVNIPDPNLRAVIESALEKAPGAPVTAIEMATLTSLDALHSNISDLTGLETAIRLTVLLLSGNNIADISHLAVLTNLTVLWLGSNGISDISHLAALTNLSQLLIDGNRISDISALVSNTGLGSGDVVDLRRNPLNSESINTHIPVLQDRGVTVSYDDIVVQTVNIPDPNLRAVIESELDKAPGTPITATEMADLTSLDALDSNISDITGLETAIGLTVLLLSDNSIADISSLADLTKLRLLWLGSNSIADISSLADLTNLSQLLIDGNSIADISALVSNTGLGSGDEVDLRRNPLNAESINTHIPVLQDRGVTVSYDDIVAQTVNIPDPNLRAVIESELDKAPGAPIITTEMATLTNLDASSANISDLTGIEAAIRLTILLLGSNSISDISPITHLTNLTQLFLDNNSISDISVLSNLTNLTQLVLNGNTITDISPLSNLTNLTQLFIENNSISDISAISNLTNLTQLVLNGNTITDISPLSNLTNLTQLFLNNNSISDISAISNLTNLTHLRLKGNRISDISPLASNAGLGVGDYVDVSENPLSSESTNTHIPSLRSSGVEVHAENLTPPPLEYTLSIPAGISLFHVPLRVTEVNGREQIVGRISDLYDVLGGASTVNFLSTLDSSAGAFRIYFGASNIGTTADKTLLDETGIVANLKNSVSVRLRGDALGTNGFSSINLNQEFSLVGLPLNDSRVTRVSDLFALEGIRGNVNMIILIDGGEFKMVERAGDPGDIEITGGQAFFLRASRDAAVPISGEPWANDSGAAAAPSATLARIEIGNTTSVLGLKGAIVHAGTDLKVPNFRVSVKNLSTGRAVAAVTAPGEAAYHSTVVDLETGRAAAVGDILEITAQTSNLSIRVKPLRYTVTAEDVKQSLIQLPNLIAYEIPAETQLLANYPNPFNPETWIPYQLSADSPVSISIYDLTGYLVRTLSLGFKTAGFYETRDRAAYWDGRNAFGERVASGTYFYRLKTPSYNQTRRLVIIK